jgi:hypothetical protein
VNDNGKRQTELLERQIAIWWPILIVVAILFAVSLVGQGISHSNTNDKRHDRQAQQHFWRVIAGAPSPRTGPVNALALDLHHRLGPVDPQATVLPAAILSFAPDDTEPSGQDYSGITDKLGYNPFKTCRAYSKYDDNECGPLRNDVQRSLLLVKQGHLSDVTDALVIPPPPGRYIFLPFHMSFWLFLLIMWLGLGTIVYFIARVVLADNSDAYRHRLLNLSWEMDGDHTGTKLANLFLGFAIIGPYLAVRGPQSWRQHRRYRRDYPDAMRVADRLSGVIRSLNRHGPSGDSTRIRHNQLVNNLRQQRDNLLASLSGIGDIETIQQEAQDVLDGLRLRPAIVDQLNRDYPVVQRP